jgi:hypothetical protein
MWKEWQAKGKQYLDRALGVVKGHPRESSRARGQPRESDMLGSTCTVQVCRSVSTWSHDVPTEQSIQNACKFLPVLIFKHRKLISIDISLIHDAKHFIYLYVSSTRAAFILLITHPARISSCEVVFLYKSSPANILLLQ